MPHITIVKVLCWLLVARLTGFQKGCGLPFRVASRLSRKGVRDLLPQVSGFRDSKLSGKSRFATIVGFGSILSAHHGQNFYRKFAAL